ncbi:hypothetical protein FDUTEX481_02802 [Tolypothrix sp. PCC 7601]|nr:hypothetical protein FDUTEX481_02802 [Tolypothrix sp. PCC 7601]
MGINNLRYLTKNLSVPCPTTAIIYIVLFSATKSAIPAAIHHAALAMMI